MRSCRLGFAGPVSDAATLWDFREALAKADASEDLFRWHDRANNVAGFLARGRQIVGRTLVASRRQKDQAVLAAKRRVNRVLVAEIETGREQGAVAMLHIPANVMGISLDNLAAQGLAKATFHHMPNTLAIATALQLVVPPYRDHHGATADLHVACDYLSEIVGSCITLWSVAVSRAKSTSF